MGNIDKRRPKITEKVVEQRKIDRAVKKTKRTITRYITEMVSAEGLNVPQRQLEAQIDAYMTQLEKEIQSAVLKTVSDGYLTGEAQHIIAVYDNMTKELAMQILGVDNPNHDMHGIPKAGYIKNLPDDVLQQLAERRLLDEGMSLEQAKKIVPVSVSRNKAIRALFTDTYGDILLATNNTSKAVKRVVREATREALQYQALRDRDYKAQSEDLFNRLSKKGLSKRLDAEGFVGIVDRAGRRWDLQTYTNMVSVTKTNQAFREGVIDFAKESGMDLAVISNHGAKDACSLWEGVVVSLTGATKGYPLLSDAIATNEIFHPNCKHKLHVIETIDELHVDDILTSDNKMYTLGDVKKRKYVSKSKKMQ